MKTKTENFGDKVAQTKISKKIMIINEQKDRTNNPYYTKNHAPCEDDYSEESNPDSIYIESDNQGIT